MPDQVPTAREVAALPKLAEKIANAMAQAGEIPTLKSQWRANRTEFDQWIDEEPCFGAGGDRDE